jgi:S1-C subfamily serine protease
MEFVEPEDEFGLFRNPLPPDDRLWRHPSEVGGGLPADRPGSIADDPSPSPVGGAPGDDSKPSLWLVAAVSAVSAGLLATGLVMVVVGLMGADQLRPAVERQMEPRPIDAISSGDVVDVAGRARAAVAQLRLDGGSAVIGSGVIFRSDGHMLTSAAVVGRATSLRVTLDSGRELTGRVLGTDPDTDTAVVKIDGEGPFPTAVLGTATDLRVGEQAIAIGCPIELVGGPSVTVGVISALHRSVPRDTDGGLLLDMVQTDARVPTGWPGGALLDSSGSVIGITTSVGTTGTGSGGFGFAIPIDVARAVADQLINDGRVTAVWLGVQGADLDWVSAARLEVVGGAVVGDVMAGSPAAHVGLSASDVIVGLDGVAVTSMGQLVVALRLHRPGDAVRLDVMREHERMSMVVVLTERPHPA